MRPTPIESSGVEPEWETGALQHGAIGHVRHEDPSVGWRLSELLPIRLVVRHFLLTPEQSCVVSRLSAFYRWASGYSENSCHLPKITHNKCPICSFDECVPKSKDWLPFFLSSALKPINGIEDDIVTNILLNIRALYLKYLAPYSSEFHLLNCSRTSNHSFLLHFLMGFL